jgi:hypothetical protein
MLLAASTALLAAGSAFSKTFGLIVVFGGIGLVVNVIVIFMAIQIRSERNRNREDFLTGRRPRT